MATYVQIQAFIKEKYGESIDSCHIAHVLDMHALVGKPAPNRISPDSRVKKCSEKKILLIEEALRYFGMLNKK
ncbi:Uncharacterised protein [Serratia fonticola]|uniref:hypothetical protein n=1 Tax=Serratia fonticola TaxID=47917 RepID=UPI0021783DB4|nr:hypothetical protein [Serratia fonticola]CAI1522922.1 Uncharacterised protein [Serratia fonticola]